MVAPADEALTFLWFGMRRLSLNNFGHLQIFDDDTVKEATLLHVI